MQSWGLLMRDIGSKWRRVRAATVGFLLVLTPVVPAPAEDATGTTSLSGFVVASDGRLYRAPAPTAGSAPASPSLTSTGSGVVAPPGADISTVRQRNGDLALFLIGAHGGLIAATTSTSGSGLTFFNVGSGGLAVPGSKVSAVTAPDGVHVFFPGHDGSIYAVSFGSRVGPQPVPWQVSQPGLASASTTVAAAWDPTGVPGVFFVGDDGGLHSVWRDGNTWTTHPVSPPGVAPPGGGVAALSIETPAQAFYTSNDGTLWQVTHRPGHVTYEPAAITTPGTVPPGAQLTAARLGPRTEPWRAALFFAAADGAIHVAARLESEWLPPAATATPGTTVPGAPVSVAATPDDPFLYVAWCGNDSQWTWLRLRKPIPPPPQPSWYGERFTIRPVAPLWPRSNVSAVIWGI